MAKKWLLEIPIEYIEELEKFTQCKRGSFWWLFWAIEIEIKDSQKMQVVFDSWWVWKGLYILQSPLWLQLNHFPIWPVLYDSFQKLDPMAFVCAALKNKYRAILLFFFWSHLDTLGENKEDKCLFSQFIYPSLKCKFIEALPSSAIFWGSMTDGG